VGTYELGSSGSGFGQTTDSCEHDNGLSDFIKGEEFLN